MKKLVFAVCMLFGGVVLVNAQDSTSTSSPTDPTMTEESQTSQPSTASTSSQEEGRVKIKSQDLPDAVKSSLEGQEFRGWLVNSAYKVDGSASGSSTSSSDSTSVSSDQSGSQSGSTGSQSGSTGSQSGQVGMEGSGQEAYIVELKNGAQTKTVRFDKDGKKLEDEGMQDDQE